MIGYCKYTTTRGYKIAKRHNSRLAGISGVYMPGRDRFLPLDVTGWGAALISLLLIVLHAAGRIVMAARRKEDD